jgi:exodeoxyribonuclease-3
MKIATWNVNSLKVRLGHLLNWLEQSSVDVVCLQELKLTDDKFPVAELAAAGYASVFTGQKTYNGVAIIARTSLAMEHDTVVKNIPGFDDPQQRVIAATVAGCRIVCGYFPNGQAPGTDKFAYKLQWLAALHSWLATELAHYPQLALLGDFNIAPEDRDVHDPKAWEGQNLVSPEERAAFAGLLDLGLTDTFRLFEQAERTFSWWDYRMLGFRRNAGLRIDHVLTSPALTPAVRACHIDKVPRGWEQPSDHAPVVVELQLP